jgi:preprotein translocase subunit SecG
MLSVLLTIHLIACIALVIAVMLQRSEGGALGMSGGGTGGIISGRGAASVLVKTTMGLAIVFFITSVAMTRLNNDANNAPGVLEREVQEKTATDPFDPLGPATATPPATTATTPSTTAPAATAPAAPAPAPAIDPLAPKATAPAAVTPSAATTPTPAPATTPPASTTTPPQNGGSPN